MALPVTRLDFIPVVINVFVWTLDSHDENAKLSTSLFSKQKKISVIMSLLIMGSAKPEK
jgi:hypothetical protein